MQSSITESWVLNLDVADLDLISDILYCPQVLPGAIPGCRTMNEPWAQLAVYQSQNEKKTETQCLNKKIRKMYNICNCFKKSKINRKGRKSLCDEDTLD